MEATYFNQYAERLRANGFTVTPTRGKHAFVPKWPNSKPTDPQWLAKVIAKNRYAGCNVGIVCGRVVAIDIDELDPAKIEQIKGLAAEHLGPTAFERVGHAPKTLLLYRPGDRIPSIKIAGCIDVLSEGRQFVAYGIHPDTGSPYRWTDRHFNPATARVDELPILNPASLEAFAGAVCAALGSTVAAGKPATRADLKARQRARQGEMEPSSYDSRIQRNHSGLVVEGREAFLAQVTMAEYAKDTSLAPDALARRTWARFQEQAELGRAKGTNPRKRWSLADALAKARFICRRKPSTQRPRRSRRGHPASHLHSFRKPGYWTAEKREGHLAETGRRLTAPAVLAVARVMIESVDLQDGFCRLPLQDAAKLASCSVKSVKDARVALSKSGLWLSAPGRGVFIPVPIEGLNRKQRADNTGRERAKGTTKVPSLYHLSVSSPVPGPPAGPPGESTPDRLPTYQADLFGAVIVDLASYRRGPLPTDLADAVRATLRATGTTQEELASVCGISQPQVANVLAGRFGLSVEVASRLLDWLQARTWNQFGYAMKIRNLRHT